MQRKNIWYLVIIIAVESYDDYQVFESYDDYQVEMATAQRTLFDPQRRAAW